PPDLVGAAIALGEVGGYSMHVGDAVFFPIQVAEKRAHRIRLVTNGPSGHGSQPIRDGAMAAAGRVLDRLSAQRLPLHVTPIVERFVRGLAEAQPELLGLLDPQRCGQILAEAGSEARMLEAILHNTP